MNCSKAGVDSDLERRPLSVDEFQTLLTYLTTFERYSGQRKGNNASDRRLIYWFAVSTGLRQNEIRQLRVNDVWLDTNPPRVRVRAGTAKNAKEAPINWPKNLLNTGMILNRLTGRLIFKQTDTV